MQATSLPDHVDVAVVGAGTAGAASAAFCAAAGLRTLCVDRGPLERAGARWVNGVPAWAFDQAGLAPPSGDERRGGDIPFHLIAGWGPRRLLIEDHGVLEVDMRHLVSRLQRLARERGACLAGEIAVTGVSDAGLETASGPVRARWVIDAGGLAGPRLLGQPKVAPRDLCAAAQQVREVTDPGVARAFFEAHGVAPGEVLCFTGVAGGYSIVNVRIDGDAVSLLTGTIPADGHASGKALLEKFVREQPWIGRQLFGGARAVPLRRPFDRLTDGRVALLGDAGCQVFPAHGSGIAAGILAARVLADALAETGDLHDYAVRWQRTWGGLMASYDLFRRFSQRLEAAELERLMARGVMDADTVRYGMMQVHPQLPPLADLLGKLAALASEPALSARLLGVLGRMAAARALYARYPRDPRRQPAWSRRIARVFGELPDSRAVGAPS
jgi:flavin-dependent dehydrogenase